MTQVPIDENLLSVNSYNFDLPESLIAKYPLEQRSASKLLVINNDNLSDNSFHNIIDLLDEGDLIVFNDTRVMKARLFGAKDTGGKVEVLVEKITHDEQFTQGYEHVALCHVRASKAPKQEQSLLLADGNIPCKVIGRHENLFIIAFDEAILPNLEAYGELPIPPYFNRKADSNDEVRYQTVFNNPEKLASVAAPTASLHFDDAILEQLQQKGINKAFVTLHVGAGTFAPVKTDNILEHTMHSEYADLPQSTADAINATHARGKKVIAVGTTVTRVLESAYKKTVHSETDILKEWSGDTDIFIYPGFKFGVIDRLITNFHLPKSTLLMLVSAFAGKENMMNAYAHAIQCEYRFFSYGDSMIIDKSHTY